MNKDNIDKIICCQLECGKLATWEVWTGNLPDDFTHSCDDHLAGMCELDKENRVYRLPSPGEMA